MIRCDKGEGGYTHPYLNYLLIVLSSKAVQLISSAIRVEEVGDRGYSIELGGILESHTQAHRAGRWEWGWKMRVGLEDGVGLENGGGTGGWEWGWRMGVGLEDGGWDWRMGVGLEDGGGVGRWGGQ